MSASLAIATDGFFGGGGAAAADAVAPTVSVVSPTPGVAPGSPGGFPSSYSAARTTPIVVDVTDVDPGVEFVVVIARYYVDSESGNPNEEVVYRRGQFRGLYIEGSSASVIANGLRLSVMRKGGWPTNSSGGIAYIAFAVDALDAAGNLAT